MNRPLARQVARFAPSRLLLVERSEPALYTVDRDLREAWPSLSIVPVVGDVGDRERMLSVFREHGVQVVAHAAAHKHVPLMHDDPGGGGSDAAGGGDGAGRGRPGEKLFEELQYSGESIDKTRHPKITIGKIAGVPADELAFALSRLRELAASGSSDEIRAFLGALLPEAQMNGGANGAAPPAA